LEKNFLLEIFKTLLKLKKLNATFETRMVQELNYFSSNNSILKLLVMLISQSY